VEQVLPPNVDEMKAETENDLLDKNTLTPVEVADDDFVHMEVHNKAADTSAKFAHIEAHKRAMMLKRVKPEFDLAKQRPENPTQVAPIQSPGVSFMPAGGAAIPAGGKPIPVGE